MTARKLISGRIFCWPTRPPSPWPIGFSACSGQVLGELISAIARYAADRREHGVLYPLADTLGKASTCATAVVPRPWTRHGTTPANTIASIVTALDQPN